jgi:anthranilate/para-aminobenzoate synthase component II
MRAPEPRHGRTSPTVHENSQLFDGIPSPFIACRYHSLVVDEASLPAELRITARATDDGSIMAIEHKRLPLFGVQFHPEAILTEHGYHILANFLQIAGCRVAADPVDLSAQERLMPRTAKFAAPANPVTF